MIGFAFEKVPQVPLTYSYVADEMYDPRRLGMQPAVFVNGMNEYGVVMCSNCFRSREPHVLTAYTSNCLWSPAAKFEGVQKKFKISYHG
jgi:hypothetical protein